MRKGLGENQRFKFCSVLLFVEMCLVYDLLICEIFFERSIQIDVKSLMKFCVNEKNIILVSISFRTFLILTFEFIIYPSMCMP